MNNNLKHALYYVEEMGFSVIPIGKDKKPLVDWKKYQKQKATKAEIVKWFSDPDTNIGIVTGTISNLIVVDIDPRHGGTDEAFNDIQTVKCRTGGGGWHYYFIYEEGIQNGAGIKDGIDIRAEGGYVVAPPSTHSSGKNYKWIMPPKTDTKIQPLPQFVKEWIKNSRGRNDGSVDGRKSNWDANVLKGVSEGGRNNSAASMIGAIFRIVPREEWEGTGWGLFEAWNSKNNPPLSKRELENVFYSIRKSALENTKEEKEGEKEYRSESDKLIDLTLRANVEVYLDDAGIPYISFPEKNIIGHPINSSEFKFWLAGNYWKEQKKGLSRYLFSTVVNSLEGKAFAEGEKKVLYNRLARLEDAMYYDLGDDIHAVKITAKGWEITKDCPVKFRRFSHQKPQVHPIKGGTLDSVLKYVNLKTENDKKLFLTYLLAVSIPDIPRVVLICVGEQGAAKSTALRIAGSLIDPSISELLSPPKDMNNIVQTANHHYCLYIDNLSYLNEEDSDMLCRLATGIGFEKRRLFTDDGDVLYNQKVAVGITGISLVPNRSDLLDRCLILNLERISEEKRIDEEDFWKNFNNEKPYILGALFTALSDMLRILPDLKLSRKPRMADYAKYATAGAMALGGTPEDFLDAFNGNVKRQNDAAIEASPVAQTILYFMEEQDQDEWSGFSRDLYKELRERAEKLNFNIGRGGFPATEDWLWKKIMYIKPNLSALGIPIDRSETARGTIITIKKRVGNGSMAAVAVDTPGWNSTVKDQLELLE